MRGTCAAITAEQGERRLFVNCSQPRSPSTRGTKGGDGGGKEEKRKDARMRALINGGPLQHAARALEPR